MKKGLFWVMVLVLAIAMMTGCGKKDEDAGENVVEEISWLSAQTAISYSAGDDSNWAYGNQRKEFPDKEACYVRIASTLISEKNKKEEVTITYRFTGVENCKVELSDGIAEKVETDDKNVIEYRRVVTAEKEKKAKESIVIFQYTPNGAESITLEVFYDDQVASKYDDRNTIYFSDDTTAIDNGIH